MLSNFRSTEINRDMIIMYPRTREKRLNGNNHCRDSNIVHLPSEYPRQWMELCVGDRRTRRGMNWESRR